MCTNEKIKSNPEFAFTVFKLFNFIRCNYKNAQDL